MLFNGLKMQEMYLTNIYNASKNRFTIVRDISLLVHETRFPFCISNQQHVTFYNKDNGHAQHREIKCVIRR